MSEHYVNQEKADVEQQEEARQLEDVVEVEQNDIPNLQSELDHVEDGEAHFAGRVPRTSEGYDAKHDITRNRYRPDQMGFFCEGRTLQAREFEAQKSVGQRVLGNASDFSGHVGLTPIATKRLREQREKTHLIKMRHTSLNRK